MAGLSVFLVIHLFILGVGIVGNAALSSRLEQYLGANVFPAYRRALYMDLSYGFGMGSGESIDDNHALEVDLTLPDGSRQKLVYPETKNGERARHWRMLARNMAAYVGDDSVEPLLPTGIGQSLLDKYEAKQAIVTVKGHQPQLPSLFTAAIGDPPRGAWQNTYQARVWKSGLNTRLMKLEGRSETAPVATPRNTQPAVAPSALQQQ